MACIELYVNCLHLPVVTTVDENGNLYHKSVFNLLPTRSCGSHLKQGNVTGYCSVINFIYVFFIIWENNIINLCYVCVYWGAILNIGDTFTNKPLVGSFTTGSNVFGHVTGCSLHIATTSVGSHWLVSPSEPAGCDCLDHNATRRTGALDSHWSADGCENRISTVIHSTHPELCVCASVPVFMYLYYTV